MRRVGFVQSDRLSSLQSAKTSHNALNADLNTAYEALYDPDSPFKDNSGMCRLQF